MVTVELTTYQSRILTHLLASDKREFLDGIKTLEELEQTDPDRKLGPRKQTPTEALKYTRTAVKVIDAVLAQTKGH